MSAFYGGEIDVHKSSTTTRTEKKRNVQYNNTERTIQTLESLEQMNKKREAIRKEPRERRRENVLKRIWAYSECDGCNLKMNASHDMIKDACR